MNQELKRTLVFETKNALVKAISMFLSRDKDLPIGVHERTSVARIAHYLANFIEGEKPFKDNNIVVDVDYNRKGKDAKTLDNKRIYPDLIVHRRECNNRSSINVLICEFKNESDSTSDAERITKMVHDPQYGYFVGTKLIINQLRAAGNHEIKIEWIEKNCKDPD